MSTMRRFSYYDPMLKVCVGIYRSPRPCDAARKRAVEMYRFINLSGGDMNIPIYLAMKDTTTNNKFFCYKATRTRVKCRKSRPSVIPITYRYQTMVKTYKITWKEFMAKQITKN